MTLYWQMSYVANHTATQRRCVELDDEKRDGDRLLSICAPHVACTGCARRAGYGVLPSVDVDVRGSLPVQG